MSIRQFVAGAAIASICGGLLPTLARASDGAPLAAEAVAQTGQPVAQPGLRAAIDRAASQLAADPQVGVQRQPVHRSATQAAAEGGGGGGHVGLIISLVSLAAGGIGTYYAIKELRKTTNQINQINK